MSEKTVSKKPLALALGAAFATSLSLTPAASAAENPFGMTDLDAGYRVAATEVEEGAKAGAKEAAEGRCGGKMKEGACGGKMKEGACGASMEKKAGEVTEKAEGAARGAAQ